LRTKFWSQADRDYTAALRQVGIDVDALPTKEAADRITSRRQIASALVPALDDWVAVRSIGDDQAATRRLIDVLRTADADPWRQRVRDAIQRKDWTEIEELARSADLDRQPAATISLLCATLRAQANSDIERPGEQEGELGSRGFLLESDILRRAQRKYPADFWINHRLGVGLIWTSDPNDVREGIGYMRAAVAVRPESAHAIMNLGNGYSYLGRHDDGIAYYRKAMELRTDYWQCYFNLGISLCRKGLHEEAIGAFQEAIRIDPNDPAMYAAYAALSLIYSNRPDAHLRKPSRAAELANKVIEFEPLFGNHWTALGIARYREGQWQEARTAFDRALQIELGSFTGGTFRWPEAIDWFFLAMCYWQMGQQDQARECYDRAVQSMEKRQTGQADIDQLRRIRAEAEELLKIADEKPTAKPESN
jgi:tetratricopeptide (TPR) repeat protein